MIRIQASPTWRCNYYDFQKADTYGKNCPYCNLFSPMKTEDSSIRFHANKDVKISKEMTAQQWLRGLLCIISSATDTVEFDFTGGEPLVYSEFPQLIELISPYALWSITSNTVLTGKLRELFSKRIKPPRSWTASWHRNGLVNFATFLDNLKYVKDCGAMSTSCTIVLHEGNYTHFQSDIQTLQREGFRVQAHLFMSPQFQHMTTGIDSVNKIYEEHKHLFIQQTDDWDKNPEGVEPIRDCVAGHKSISVSSDGAVYLCYEHLFVESEPPIGQWGEYTLSNDPTKNCSWPCRFSCDVRNIIPKRP